MIVNRGKSGIDSFLRTPAHPRLEQVRENITRFLSAYRSGNGQTPPEKPPDLRDVFFRDAINFMPANVAVLDETGTIQYVNEDWRRFARDNDFAGDSAGVGLNYIEVCEQAAPPHNEGAPETAAALHQMLAGSQSSFAIEYPCHSPTVRRWFTLRAAAFAHSGKPYVIVSHQDITRRKEAFERNLAYQQQLRAMASELTTLEERQRKQIALELHDVVAQQLTACIFQLGTLQATNDPSEIQSQLQEVRRQLSASIDQIRSLCFDLASPALYELGLEAAVCDFLEERIRKRYRIETVFEDDQQPKPLATEVRTVIYRIIQEVLINVVKHAQASQVTVRLAREDEKIRIEIADNGIGFDCTRLLDDLADSRCLGLFSIRERADYIGGTFHIESSRDGGTRISITAPLLKSDHEKPQP